MTRLTALTTLAALTFGCATIPKRVQRDSGAYAAEVLAGLAREQDAAAALFEAADNALSAGDVEACRRFVAPALVIQRFAELEAHRALWLAGLPYPVDGVMPDPRAEQPDPMEGREPVDPADPLLHCEED
jgi:hypothetical protein